MFCSNIELANKFVSAGQGRRHTQKVFCLISLRLGLDISESELWTSHSILSLISIVTK